MLKGGLVEFRHEKWHKPGFGKKRGYKGVHIGTIKPPDNAMRQFFIGKKGPFHTVSEPHGVTRRLHTREQTNIMYCVFYRITKLRRMISIQMQTWY